MLAWRQPGKGLVIALFPVAYWGLVGSGYTVFARYILPAVPFLCLTAAFAITELSRTMTTLRGRPNRAPATSCVLALLVIGPSAWSVVQFNRLLSRTDSRVLAAQWVRARFPEGANIAEVGRHSTRLFFLPEDPTTPSRYKTTRLAEDFEATPEPDILVVPRSLFSPGWVIPPRAAELSARYRPLSEIVAHDPFAKGVVFDWQDDSICPEPASAASGAQDRTSRYTSGLISQTSYAARTAHCRGASLSRAR